MSTGFGDLRRWEVQRGDDMRSIAAQVLEEGWRRPPNDEEVAAYLKNIVELNRGRLEDSQHAGLLMPGQILLMPRLPRPHAR